MLNLSKMNEIKKKNFENKILQKKKKILRRKKLQALLILYSYLKIQKVVYEEQ